MIAPTKYPMQITDSTLLLQLQAGNKPDKLLQNMRPGQILHATTLSTTQNGVLQVQIGRNILTAESNIALSVGTKLALSVSKVGEQPQLKIITSLPPKLILQQTMINALPKQQPLQPLLQNLSSLLASGDPIPPPLQRLASSFINSILASSDPAFNQNIKAAVNRSGPFLEAHLINGSLPKQELKATLLKMIQVLKPLLEQSGQMQNGKLLSPSLQQTAAPPTSAIPLSSLNKLVYRSDSPLQQSSKQPLGALTTAKVAAPAANPFLQQLVDLFKGLEGVLARIQLHQIATLQSEEGNKTVWQLELPIRHANQTDSFEMRIERQKQGSSSDEASHAWTLTIKFDLKPLGPMHANLTLRGGDELSTIFWAKQQQTLSLLHKNMPLLRSNLEKIGLKVNRIEAYHGEPFKEAQTAWQSTLLDEKA